MMPAQTTEIAPELLIDHALAQVEADPRVQRALADLQEIIQAHFPTATFKVVRWTDPAGIYLKVDVVGADSHEVREVVQDRLLEVQFEQQLPVDLMMWT